MGAAVDTLTLICLLRTRPPGRGAVGALVVVVLLASTVAAQSHPDFSGEWVLDTPGVTSERIARELIVHHEERRTTAVEGTPVPLEFMSGERRYANRVQRSEYQVGLAGGVVGGIPAGQQFSSSSAGFSVNWKANALVIEEWVQSGETRSRATWSEHREEWTLEFPNRLTIGFEDRGFGLEPLHVDIAYRRR